MGWVNRSHSEADFGTNPLIRFRPGCHEVSSPLVAYPRFNRLVLPSPTAAAQHFLDFLETDLLTTLQDARPGGLAKWMFRILVVDDNPSVGQILSEVAKDLRHSAALSFVGNGEEALGFLHRQGAYAEVRRPHLILLDMNMPGLGGLATLSAIKADPVLRMIPVIMFSTTTSPEDLRKSYQAHANGFVQKPADLQRSAEFIKAVEAFWINFAHLADSDLVPSTVCDAVTVPTTVHLSGDCAVSGPHIPRDSGEDISRGLESAAVRLLLERAVRRGCEEHERLLEKFGTTVKEVLKLHEQQFLAIVEGEDETQRFDLLIHMANENKQAAKYDYLQHVEIHGCSKFQ
jgi:chemotaxis family two-component system response regulator Rcp1